MSEAKELTVSLIELIFFVLLIADQSACTPVSVAPVRTSDWHLEVLFFEGAEPYPYCWLHPDKRQRGLRRQHLYLEVIVAVLDAVAGQCCFVAFVTCQHEGRANS